MIALAEPAGPANATGPQATTTRETSHMAIAQSRKVEISEIPVVDLGLLPQGAAAQARLFGDMRDACESVGFFYVKNHRVSRADTPIIFHQCRRVFAIPMAERQALRPTPPPPSPSSPP